MNIKKLFLGIFVFIVIFTCSVLGYSEQDFEIEIPEEYFEVIDEETGVKVFTNAIGNFSIIVKDNENSADLTTFTNEQIKAIENDIDKALEEDNMPNEMLGSKIVKVNGYDALYIKNKCTKTFETEYDIYQHKYIFTTENKIYYVTYSTVRKETIQDFEEILKTFKIKDDLLEENNQNTNNKNTSDVENNSNETIFLLVILAIVLIVLIIVTIIVIKKLRK